MDKHWNGKVKKLMKQSRFTGKRRKTSACGAGVEIRGQAAAILFAQAASDDVLTEKISVITNQTYTGQLSGDTLSISKLQQAEKRKAISWPLRILERMTSQLELTKHLPHITFIQLRQF